MSTWVYTNLDVGGGERGYGISYSALQPYNDRVQGQVAGDSEAGPPSSSGQLLEKQFLMFN